MARYWCLDSHPRGLPVRSDFRLIERPDAPLADGEVRVRNLWLSVDPSMRVRMNGIDDGYMPPFGLGAPLTGGAVGEVVESRNADVAVGAFVNHMAGWRDLSVVAAGDIRTLPATHLPLRYYLHLLGVVGYTAYVGLDLMEGKAGETAFISAAGGAVGLAAVQMAKIAGLQVVGSAGGAEKCVLVASAGADRVVDYKAAGTMSEKLNRAAPQGIDLYFDNVGGDHLDAALGAANLDARMAISGMIGSYNGDPDAEIPMRHLVRIVTRRIRLQGFMARDRIAGMPAFRTRMTEWIDAGRMQVHETVFAGLDAMPDALIALFAGSPRGKILVDLS